MAPVPLYHEAVNLYKRLVTKPTSSSELILEAWGQGFMVGALIIMLCITLANMRRGVLLHKLILLELFLGLWHGFWIFFDQPIYAWWLSISAIPLNTSWSLHNVIAWMKIKPFLPRYASWLFIGTVILVQPYWVVEIYANFTYFHNVNNIFERTRPFEALCRDPWWIFTTIALFYNIKTRYELTVPQICRISPRFAIMLVAMLISIGFIILDICSVTSALKSALPDGLNPFWKLAFVFKCLTDSVILDDFKTALDRLRAYKINRLGNFAIDDSDHRRARGNRALESSWAEVAAPNGVPAVASPDGDYLHHDQEPHWPVVKEVEHIERRNPSRDRDSKENAGVAVADHERRVREGSDAHILRPSSPWGKESSASEEYARAVREVTNNDSTRNNPDHFPEKDIGTAR